MQAGSRKRMQVPYQVRAAREGDLPALHANMMATVQAGLGVVRIPSDMGTIEQFAARMMPLLDAERASGFLLVAECGADPGVDGNMAVDVAGAVVVRRPQPSMVHHIGTLGLEVHPTYQGRGVGRALLREAIEVSAREGVIRLELSVRSDNVRALHLYDSEGFTREFTRRAYVRLPGGAFLDDYGYVRFLSNAG
jgi:ribosomal protein S18 acetylase RimI-like enzyme